MNHTNMKRSFCIDVLAPAPNLKQGFGILFPRRTPSLGRVQWKVNKSIMQTAGVIKLFVGVVFVLTKSI